MSYGSTTAAAGAAAPGRRRLPTWAIVLIILAVLFIIVAGILGAVIPSLIFRTTETLANDAAVSSGVRTIQTGIETYAAEHNGMYPAAEDVTSAGLSRYVTSWPVNPYTDLPMMNSGGAGNFDYQPGAGGTTYRIVGFGRDGDAIIDYSSGGEGSETY